MIQIAYIDYYYIQFTLQTTLLRLSVLKLTTSHTFMYKKLDEFGQNHDEKIRKRLDDKSKRLTEIKKEKAAQSSNEETAATENVDATKKFQVNQQKMQAIARGIVYDKIDKETDSEEFLEEINKLERRKNYATLRRTENTNDEQQDNNKGEKGKVNISILSLGFLL